MTLHALAGTRSVRGSSDIDVAIVHAELGLATGEGLPPRSARAKR